MWAGVIASLSGAIVGFFMNFWMEKLRRCREHTKFLNGLYADVNRCLEVELTPYPNELLNRLVFPYLEGAIRDGKIYSLRGDVHKYILQLFYLIDNFHRYCEAEIGLVVDEARALVQTKTEVAQVRDIIRAEALSMLEKSFYTYATLAKQSLNKYYPRLKQKDSLKGRDVSSKSSPL
ncbi:hypothetical protein [Alicyclobacillus tolerans]|uniref:Uncharacterized protein n=1 Tax=Alicyclobacillus tolerans TaxID=90970 RepID=A0A1M6LNQ4_9BACL|nr:hypothetical protein [Alicyclobacillus montanus]SHJ72836.1 hypothetical protein SAMN05443507_10332 [Alicyclobacillus montanus]